MRPDSAYCWHSFLWLFYDYLKLDPFQLIWNHSDQYEPIWTNHNTVVLISNNLENKKCHIRETKHLSTNAESITDTKKTLLVRQNSPKSFFKNARRFYTLYKQKFSNLGPLLSITFLKGFRKSKNFGHLTLESGGKKTLKWSEQMKKNLWKTFSAQWFCTMILHPLQENVCKSETTYFQYFSPIIPKINFFGHLTSRIGGKKTVKRSEKLWNQKNPAQLGKIGPKTNVFFCGDLHPLLV